MRRYDLLRNNTYLQKDCEDLENNKHDHLVECESHKKYVKTLNDKLVRSDDALRDC